MKKAVKLLKYIAVLLIGILACAGIYLLAAFVLSRITVPQEPETRADLYIYILTNGTHTDIVVPVKTAVIDWSKQIRFENTISKDTTYSYLGIGWGDKDFYMQVGEWSELTLPIAFKATFGLGSSAIHATYYKQLTEDRDCKRIGISTEQYKRLTTYLQKSFKYDAAGNVIYIPTDAVYELSDSFYEGAGNYNLFCTCNTWANNALKVSGQKACLWTPFQSGIFYQYRENK